MALRARKVLRTFEKRAPEPGGSKKMHQTIIVVIWEDHRVFFSKIVLIQLIVNINEKIINVHFTEDLGIQVDGVKLPAEESKLPQVNNQEENFKSGFGAGTSGEQYIVEEKNLRQARWQTYNDDSSDDEDFTSAAEEWPTQEDKLQYMKIDEVSWAKIKG